MYGCRIPCTVCEKKKKTAMLLQPVRTLMVAIPALGYPEMVLLKCTVIISSILLTVKMNRLIFGCLSCEKLV